MLNAKILGILCFLCSYGSENILDSAHIIEYGYAEQYGPVVSNKSAISEYARESEDSMKERLRTGIQTLRNFI